LIIIGIRAEVEAVVIQRQLVMAVKEVVVAVVHTALVQPVPEA